MHGLPAATGGNGAFWRVVQFLSVLGHRHDPEVDLRLRNAVQNDDQWRLLLRLPSFDRAHHLRVRDALIAAGHNDPDLLLAAALHDVGKADERGQVRLFHRVIYVLLRRCSPATLASITNGDGNWLTHGLFLAVHHARLGADLVARTGASPRSCALIAQHELLHVHQDSELQALIAADEGAIV